MQRYMEVRPRGDANMQEGCFPITLPNAIADALRTCPRYGRHCARLPPKPLLLVPIATLP